MIITIEKRRLYLSYTLAIFMNKNIDVLGTSLGRKLVNTEQVRFFRRMVKNFSHRWNGVQGLNCLSCLVLQECPRTLSPLLSMEKRKLRTRLGMFQQTTARCRMFTNWRAWLVYPHTIYYHPYVVMSNGNVSIPCHIT